MFTIKNYRENGYAAYETDTYEVSFVNEPDGIVPQVALPCDDNSMPPFVITVESDCYIENSAGKTMEHLKNTVPVDEPVFAAA